MTFTGYLMFKLKELPQAG